MPEDAAARAEALRWLDWAMGPFHDSGDAEDRLRKSHAALHRRARRSARPT